MLGKVARVESTQVEMEEKMLKIENLRQENWEKGKIIKELRQHLDEEKKNRFR